MDTPITDDDAIIALLKRDAQNHKSGTAFPATKRDKNAPKPNTRFLRNLVRDTDSHNAALLAKERAETRARLKGLEPVTKRGRDDGEAVGDASSKRRRREGEREGRWKGVLSGLGKSNARERDGEPRKHTSRAEKPRHRDRDTERNRDRDRDAERHSHRRRRSRSPSSRSRSRSPQHTHRSHDHKHRSTDHHKHNRSRSPPTRNSNPTPPPQSHPKQPLSDTPSDPLEPFLGPAPPPKTLPRGRGANSTRATIDLRFNDPDYNPRTDFEEENSENEDVWANSLEAMRDRAAWRVKGAERLRAAGFGEREVGVWEGRGSGIGHARGGDEEDVGRLRWRGRGEGREWDAGKVEGDDGEGRGKAAWTKDFNWSWGRGSGV